MANSSDWRRHPQRVWLRKAFFQVHLWTGVGVGLYVVLISLTGTVLIYRSELRQYFDPQPRIVQVRESRLNDEELIAATERMYPGDAVEVWTNPEDPTHAATMSVIRAGSGRQQFLFDPYSGEYLGHALPFGWRFTTWLLDLHDNLLAGGSGRMVNGVGAILLTLLGVTGAVIWWPGIGKWRRSLFIDWRENWRRLTWSLHSVMGVWTLVFILMWGVTGIYLAFPGPFSLGRCCGSSATWWPHPLFVDDDVESGVGLAQRFRDGPWRFASDDRCAQVAVCFGRGRMGLRIPSNLHAVLIAIRVVNRTSVATVQTSRCPCCARRSR